MTLDELRKRITVTSYMMRSDGIIVQYQWRNPSQDFIETRHLELRPNEVFHILDRWGIVVHSNALSRFAKWEGQEIHWYYFFLNWVFSQWDALNFAIDHEWDKDIEASINASNIGTAINKLIKK